MRVGYINNNSSIREVEEYFSNNIHFLDPIEGIYSVEVISKQESAYRRYPDTTPEIMDFFIYRKTSDKFSVISLSAKTETFEIQRIGDSNAYNCVRKWRRTATETKGRIYLDQSNSFKFSTKVPVQELKLINGEKASYITVTIHYDFTKSYPSASIINEAISKRNLVVRPKKWSGTGFALCNGYLATNYHVIEDAKSIEIQGVNGDHFAKYNANVIATDKYNDIAILKIDDVKFYRFNEIPYKIKTSSAELGEDIFVLGYPLVTTMGNEIKLTTGVISSLSGFQGATSMYQMSAPIQPGNSGGPLFDSKGNLIGIVTAKHKGAENVSYAIKSSYLYNLIKNSNLTSLLSNKNVVTELPLTGKVKKVKDFVFLIICSD